MNLKTLRQILKACADDTRLRIILLLKDKELTVKDIHSSLRVTQSTISKHLAKLRLLKLVKDKRVGNLVYYTLNRDNSKFQGQVIEFLVSQFSQVNAFKEDKGHMKQVIKKK